MRFIYKIAIILLLFLCVFIGMKLKPIWFPIFEGMKAILIPIVVAYFISFILHPFIENLHKKGISRTIAILIIYFIFFGGIGIAIYQYYPVALKQLEEIGNQSPKFVHMYDEWNRDIENQAEKMPSTIHEKIDLIMIDVQDKLSNLANSVVEIMKSIVTKSIMLLIIPFLVFYFLKDYKIFQQYFWQIIPRKWHEETKRILEEVNETLGGYIKGQFFVCFILFLMSTIIFWIVQLKYPILLGIFIGVTDVIPYFGPILGAIPAVFFAATVSMNKAIVTICIILILQFVESNILGPLIVGKTIRIHPVFIMLALLIGGTIGGFFGVLVAVPTLIVLKVIITQLRTIYFRRKIDKGV